MVSLADLRARNIVLTWQEAVAVVQELLHTVVAAHGSADQLPDLNHIALIANGDVVALPGAASTEHPVRHLAMLLRSLLDGATAPPQLQEFVIANMADPPKIDTIEEFSIQLAFFERPGRRSDVEQLVSRAMSTDATLRAEDELRRLKAKAAEAAEHADEHPEEAATAKRSLSRPLVFAGAALVVALIFAGGVWWFGRSPDTRQSQAATGQPAAGDDAQAASGQPAAGDQPVGTGSDDTTQEASSILDRTRATLAQAARAAFGGASAEKAPDAEPPAVEPATTEKTQKARPSAAARRSASSRNTARPPAQPVAPIAPPPQVHTVVTEPPMTGEPPMSVATSTELRTIIYTAADEGVMPALLLRPVLPTVPPPDVLPSQIGTLELVVNEQGDVDHVRLISPSNRFHERMLVSHAKTWKFRPAIRDGRPVKYRTVVRLTI